MDTNQQFFTYLSQALGSRKQTKKTEKLHTDEKMNNEKSL